MSCIYGYWLILNNNSNQKPKPNFYNQIKTNLTQNCFLNVIICDCVYTQVLHKFDRLGLKRNSTHYCGDNSKKEL